MSGTPRHPDVEFATLGEGRVEVPTQRRRKTEIRSSLLALFLSRGGVGMTGPRVDSWEVGTGSDEEVLMKRV